MAAAAAREPLPADGKTLEDFMTGDAGTPPSSIHTSHRQPRNKCEHDEAIRVLDVATLAVLLLNNNVMSYIHCTAYATYSSSIITRKHHLPFALATLSRPPLLAIPYLFVQLLRLSSPDPVIVSVLPLIEPSALRLGSAGSPAIGYRSKPWSSAVSPRA